MSSKISLEVREPTGKTVDFMYEYDSTRSGLPTVKTFNTPLETPLETPLDVPLNTVLNTLMLPDAMKNESTEIYLTVDGTFEGYWKTVIQGAASDFIPIKVTGMPVQPVGATPLKIWSFFLTFFDKNKMPIGGACFVEGIVGSGNSEPLVGIYMIKGYTMSATITPHGDMGPGTTQGTTQGMTQGTTQGTTVVASPQWQFLNWDPRSVDLLVTLNQSDQSDQSKEEKRNKS